MCGRQRIAELCGRLARAKQRRGHADAFGALIAAGAEQDAPVVVEYSSPNIAKPFHVGHFRSTVVGRAVTNLQRAAGHAVRTVNWIGDWGTQFGLLCAMVERRAYTDGQLAAIDLPRWYEMYVRANALAADDERFAAMGRSQFALLEAGDARASAIWRCAADTSMRYFKRLYRTLQVDFDDYHSESMYAQKASDMVREAVAAGHLIVTDEGVAGVRVSPTHFLPVCRRNGSTLYVARDVAAALHRYESCDSPPRLIYVVDVEQSGHFDSVRTVLGAIGSGRVARSVLHVPFGRVVGMRSRRGEAVLIDDVLGAGTRSCYDKLGPAARRHQVAEAERQSIARNLALSAMVVAELKERRLHSVRFNMSRATGAKGDTGVFVQRTYGRLCRLLSQFDTRWLGDEQDAVDGDGRRQCEHADTDVDRWGRLAECSAPFREHGEYLLDDKRCGRLVREIADYERVLGKAYAELEPCHVVQHMFRVSRSLALGLRSVRFRALDADRLAAAVCLFGLAERLLRHQLKLLGLTPLAHCPHVA